MDEMTDSYLREPDLVNLAGTDTGRGHLSHSGLSVLLACQQMYRLQYVERLEPKVKKISLTMGSAFAHALDSGDPQTAWDEILREHQDAVTLHAGDPWTTVPSLEEAEVNAQIAREAARAYLGRYGHHEKREVTMTVRIRNPRTGAYSRTFDLTGRVDGLTLTDGAGGRLIEDKFVAQIPRVDLRKYLKLDRQTLIGRYLVYRTTGHTIDEVCYRHTQKPGIRLKQNEAHHQFLARIADDYADRPDFYMNEEVLPPEADDFLRLEEELWRWAEMVREAKADGVFPRNVSHCANYGGCRFLSLCSRAPAAEHEFQVRPPHEEQPQETET